MNKKEPVILIVDDTPQNLQFLGTILTNNGYQLAVSRDGKGAMTHLQKVEPDLILLDIMMPEMDGYEVCQTLKRNIMTKNIPIIFLTAKTETEDLVKGFEMGAVDYITKPFKTAELLARVKTHIELKRAKEEISKLKGIIPICTKCKQIRDDKGYWNKLEKYLEEHGEMFFSHGLCPDCEKELYGNQAWYKESVACGEL